MTDLIYHSSKPVFIHNLKTLSGILKIAARDAKARAIDPNVLLNARLAPDMHPLTRQVQIATDNAKGCCARLAGVENPVFADVETSFAELQTRIQRTVDFLKGLKASHFVGSEAKEIVMQLPIGKITFSGIDYLNGWALPNFYFHYATAYNILRHNGVGIGKKDFLGAVPGMQMTGKIAKIMAAKPAAKGKKQR
ncbi:MAG: DUF1993 domain-containing protein [Halioglobus sp.]